MELKMRNELATVELEALTADTEKAVEFTERDDKMADLNLTVPVGTSLLKLESGRFKNVSGENKGKIVVVSPGTPKIGVAALV